MSKDKASKVVGNSRKRPRREVEVVSCQLSFPISSKKPRPQHQSNHKKEKRSDFLDWHKTAHEIRDFGASGFQGKQKRDFEAEQYERLTGRRKKHHQVPLPIVRGIRKKALKREAREKKEAKDAGIIMPKQPKKEKERSGISRAHGPAPSIGFMKQGVLKLKGKPV